MAPKHIKILVFFLDLLSYLVLNFENDNVRKGFLAAHKVMPRSHIGDASPIRI